MEDIVVKELENCYGYEQSYHDTQKPGYFTDDGYLHICDGKLRHCYWIGESHNKMRISQVLREYEDIIGIEPKAL